MSRTVAVLGSGAMGGGIAETAARAGWNARLFDAREGAAREAVERIARGLGQRVAKGKLTDDERLATVSRLHAASDLPECVSGADLVIEAVAEVLEVKRGLFRDASRLVGAEVPLATNTSSLSVSAIASETLHPGRVCGMHFFNPATAMKLVEVVRARRSTDAAVAFVKSVAEEWGKTAVVVKDTPGFIVNRIARPYYGEALRLLGEGAADVATVDRVLGSVGGFRMGPFALMDLVGIDVNLAVTKSVYERTFHDPKYRPHPIQQSMADSGLLGRKSGEGFHAYGD